MELKWVIVAGGLCSFGDTSRPVDVPPLCWTATPLTRGQLGRVRGVDEADLPATGIDQQEAAAIAARLGGRLPRSVEWEWMASGAGRRVYPWGDERWDPARANLRRSGLGSVTAVGVHARGATPDGLLDVAGNVWEWTASPAMGGGYIVRGGSYASPELYIRCTFLNAAPAELRSPGIGLRVVRAS